jgi:hypothetical protein
MIEYFGYGPIDICLRKNVLNIDFNIKHAPWDNFPEVMILLFGLFANAQLYICGLKHKMDNLTFGIFCDVGVVKLILQLLCDLLMNN